VSPRPNADRGVRRVGRINVGPDLSKPNVTEPSRRPLMLFSHLLIQGSVYVLASPRPSRCRLEPLEFTPNAVNLRSKHGLGFSAKHEIVTISSNGPRTIPGEVGESSFLPQIR
jgi:hypothetical protein